jgi:predicted dinucleotide-binding enzyme
MNIAVIGTGNIGGTLGRAFARAGLEVVFGSRDPGASTAAGDTSAKVATTTEAVMAADVVVVAIPAHQVADFLRAHELDGKLIVDATNNFPNPVLHSAELVARLAPRSRYARAFNSQTWETFATPTWHGIQGDLFFTSEEADQATVEQLIEAVGLRPVYLGAGQADLLDTALRLLAPIFSTHGRHVGFKVLTD